MIKGFVRLARAVAVVALAITPTNLHAQAIPTYTWVTWAGWPVHGSDDGLGPSARFYRPQGVAVGPDGSIYVADTLNQIIRKISASGQVTTLAGAALEEGSVDGSGTVARFIRPTDLAVAPDGSVYVLTYSSIRKIAPDGTVSTLAPNDQTRNLTVDSTGNVYVTARPGAGNNRIIRIAPDGTQTIIATSIDGYVDGPLASAMFGLLNDIVVTSTGELYVADAGNLAIRRIANGQVTTVASIPRTAVTHSAYEDRPVGLAIDAAGNFWVTQKDVHRLLRIAPDGSTTTVFGEAGRPGSADGVASVARFYYPTGIATAPDGKIYVADEFNATVRRIDGSGAVTTFAGTAGGSGLSPIGPSPIPGGPRLSARFNGPQGIVIRPDGGFNVADYLSCTIRSITQGGTVGVLAGPTTAWGFTECGLANGSGTSARFQGPTQLAVNASGTLYVSDTYNSAIRQITPSGVVTTVTTSLSYPAGIGVDEAGTVYVTGGNKIYKVAPDGTTMAWVTAPSFNSLQALALDSAGNVFVTNFATTYKVTPSEILSTFASVGGSGIALDRSGNLYVASGSNFGFMPGHLIYRITPEGTVSTIGGQSAFGETRDGVGTAARFDWASDIAVDSAGLVYVTDRNADTIRVGIPNAIAPAFTTNPANATISEGQTTTFSAVASGNPSAIDYRWQTSTDGGVSWATLTDAVGISGSATASLTVTGSAARHGTRYRAVATNLVGSGTSSSATLTVYHLTASPSQLRFSATKAGAGGPMVAVTPAQSVTVSLVTAMPTTWTATVFQQWLQVENGTGTGSGQFTVSVVNPSNVIGGATSLSGTLTVSAPDAGLTATITVTLDVTQDSTAGAVPFGAFDTPADGASGLVGAIAVTGWALDDIGVSRVEVWRNCIGIDITRGACAAAPNGASGVFIGRAAFLPGARPDVEGLFANRPLAYRAGWGYLMLTNALPHLPTGAAEGGQGTFTLSSYAFDVDGHVTRLGTKTITLNNDQATIPFGALDTPEQGATVPGPAFPYNEPAAYPVFGWAMTQAGKCIDTASTSSYRVYIDGVQQTLVPGTNWFPSLNRSDLAAAFPGLCNSNDALAAYYMDVRPLANGLHTIGWDVIDDQGKVAGIGSRFFTVSR